MREPDSGKTTTAGESRKLTKQQNPKTTPQDPEDEIL
jgi:hypothetical protein